MSDLGVILAAGIVFAVIGIIIGIAFYIFFSFTLFKLAQARNEEMPWLAWIPVAQMYLLGKMVKSVKISTFEIPMLEIVLPASMVVYFVLGGVSVLGTIISLAYYALSLLTLYTLYKQYLPDKAVAYTIISIFAVTIPFLLLKLSKMSPVESGESVGTDNNAQ
ncbi:MAG: hypothetical protein GXZ01_04515 [Clostridiaceae bacterium]|nr:hypothetical protein [Clostridiaceae bacterium]